MSEITKENYADMVSEVIRLREVERRLIGEASKLGAERDALRTALTKARQYINDYGPDAPGEAAGRTNDMLAMLAKVLNVEQAASAPRMDCCRAYAMGGPFCNDCPAAYDAQMAREHGADVTREK